MIVRDDRKNRSWGRWLAVLILLGAIAGLLYLLTPSIPEPTRYDRYCSAEDTTSVQKTPESKREHYFVVGEDTFFNGQTSSNAAARTGLSSSLVHAEQPYGIGYQFEDLQGGEVYELQIWRKSQHHGGDLVLDANWGEYLKAELTGQSEGDWEELILRFEVPWYVDAGQAKAYVFQPEISYVYFDDLAIRRVEASLYERRGDLPADSIQFVNLVIEENDFAKLDRKRRKALEKGILVTEKNDFVDARLEADGAEFDAKIRLKGDWTDHLLGDKWSYRVQLDQGQSWDRWTTFSLQSPATRSFLLEYVFHQWMEREGLLAPRYEFVALSINGQARGIYAIEEHFVKTLPERNARREGPILKFIEDGFWEVNSTYNPDGLILDMEERVPMFQSAEIGTFGEKKVLKDTAMAKQFEEAHRLMAQYKSGKADVWEVFDAEKVARYFAIVDLMQAHHGFIWHNQRLYYNPMLNQLEPIGFDGFTETGPLIWIKKPFIGYAQNFRYLHPAYKGMMFERFFTDTRFMASYVQALDQFSQPAYLDKMFREMAPAIDQREVLLQNEWPNYQFDRKFVHQRAENVRRVLFPLPSTAVKIYLREEADGHASYDVYNYHGLPIQLLGVGKKDRIKGEFSDQPVLPAYVQDFPPERTVVRTDRTGDWLHFEVPGIDSVFLAEILPYRAPGGKTVSQDLFANVQPQSNGIWTLDEATNTLTIPAGSHQTAESLIVPRGYHVRFEAGAQLDLVRGAAFISRSEVRSYGTAQEPVRIFSSDESARGFTILQVPDGQKCEFFYTHFESLRNLDQNNWSHTGAVSLYESEALFRHCRFTDNLSEDALNVVRSIFTVDHCHFAMTASDALDADFCTASILNATFYKTGNDAMDFSGSTVFVSKASVESPGDKALSIGEQTNATVLELTVRDAPLGVAAKDLSLTTVEKLSLHDVRRGLAVYQKKPEYGPATLTVNALEEKSVGQLYQVQKKSQLILEGQTIIGK